MNDETNTTHVASSPEAMGRSRKESDHQPLQPATGRAWGDLFRRAGSHAGARNFVWLTADRVIRVLGALIVSGILARNVGQHEFGLFAYAVAWINIIAATAGLGMEALVLRDLIESPKRAGRLIGTAIAFRMIASFVIMGVVLAVVGTLRSDASAVGLVLLLGVGVALQSLESAELWPQSKTRMRQLIIPRLAVFLVFNLAKLAAILGGYGLTVFVVVTAVEFAAGGLLTYTMVRWGSNGVGQMAIDFPLGRSLLRDSWPLAVSALVVILYMRISQLMLAGLLGDSALGTYTAALRIAEVVNPIPLLLASSFLPAWLATRDAGPGIYEGMRLRYFRLSALLAYAWCIPISLFAPLLVGLLFGPQYESAAGVLRVYVWTSVFVFMGVARSQHLLNERLTVLSLGLTVGGLVVNVLLSLFLIPRYGIMGAALAVVAAYAVAAVGSSFLFRRTRQTGGEQLLALATPWRAFAPIARTSYESKI